MSRPPLQLIEFLHSAAQWEMDHRSGEEACATLDTLMIYETQFHDVPLIPSEQATCNGDLAQRTFEAHVSQVTRHRCDDFLSYCE